MGHAADYILRSIELNDGHLGVSVGVRGYWVGVTGPIGGRYATVTIQRGMFGATENWAYADLADSDRFRRTLDAAEAEAVRRHDARMALYAPEVS